MHYTIEDRSRSGAEGLPMFDFGRDRLTSTPVPTIGSALGSAIELYERRVTKWVPMASAAVQTLHHGAAIGILGFGLALSTPTRACSGEAFSGDQAPSVARVIRLRSVYEQNLATELSEYFEENVTQGRISQATRRLAWTILENLRQRDPLIPIPGAAIGDEGEILYAWDRDEHHMECEIFQNESINFFYRNRITGALWLEERDADQDLVCEAAIEKLRLFV